MRDGVEEMEDSALTAPVRLMPELISPAFSSIRPALKANFELGPRLRCKIAGSDPAVQRVL